MKPGLLEIIACPECKGPLELKSQDKALACNRCKLAYPIDDDGIPHLIDDDATRLHGYGEESPHR